MTQRDEPPNELIYLYLRILPLLTAILLALVITFLVLF